MKTGLPKGKPVLPFLLKVRSTCSSRDGGVHGHGRNRLVAEGGRVVGAFIAQGHAVGVEALGEDVVAVARALPGHHEVAAAVHGGQSLAAQAQDLAGLGAGGDGELDLAGEGRDLDLLAGREVEGAQDIFGQPHAPVGADVQRARLLFRHAEILRGFGPPRLIRPRNEGGPLVAGFWRGGRGRGFGLPASMRFVRGHVRVRVLVVGAPAGAGVCRRTNR